MAIETNTTGWITPAVWTGLIAAAQLSEISKIETVEGAIVLIVSVALIFGALFLMLRRRRSFEKENPRAEFMETLTAEQRKAFRRLEKEHRNELKRARATDGPCQKSSPAQQDTIPATSSDGGAK
ncbi:MAG: hypothetical protein AB7P23_06315 [Amphiplicatus sp.]